MDLKSYFEPTKGHGVLATAEASGRVNLAIFARPHVMEDNSVAFIVPHRLTHNNLQSNPQAAYLFLEAGPGYKGKRLYLTKIREEQDTDLLDSLRRRTYPAEPEKQAVPAAWFSSRSTRFCRWLAPARPRRNKMPGEFAGEGDGKHWPPEPPSHQPPNRKEPA